MPGVHACIRPVRESVATCTDALLSTIRHSEKERIVIDEGPGFSCVFANEHYYPRLHSSRNDGFLLLDGIVYNSKDSDVLSRLSDMYEAMEDRSLLRRLVSSFVEEMDGDFIVVIRKHGTWLAFNDMFARLAFYYACDGRSCVLSREVKGVLGILKEVRLDRNSLVEYLGLRYPLGNRTLFESVYRLAPSEMLVAEVDAGSVNLERSPTRELVFDVGEPYADTATAQNDLAEILAKSIDARVSAAARHEAQILADLSGGFDTRAVMALLGKTGADVRYVSVKLSTGDESPVARTLWEAMGSPGSFSALDVEHGYDLGDTDELILENDGLVNYNTTVVCDRDVRALRAELGAGRFFRFSGLGGEFIRHPMKLYSRSMFSGYRRGLYSEVPDRLCRFAGIDPRAYADDVRRHFRSYPERTRDGKLRRWYYEYYNNFVGAAAEDRERTVIWTVQPLWQNEFLSACFAKVPLAWAGYQFFSGVLAHIDPRSLRAPIYGRDIRLEDQASLAAYDAKAATERSVAVGKLAFILQKDRIKRLGLRRVDRSPTPSEVARSLAPILETSPIAARLFDRHELLSYMAAHPRLRTFEQVVTIEKYLRRLEQANGIKIAY